MLRCLHSFDDLRVRLIFSSHLVENLQKSWRPIQLSAIFLIGLQTTRLGWRLILITTGQNLVETTTQIFNTQNSPQSLLSLAWFPYLILMVWVTNWIYHRQQINLSSRFTWGLADHRKCVVCAHLPLLDVQ